MDKSKERVNNLEIVLEWIERNFVNLAIFSFVISLYMLILIGGINLGIYLYQELNMTTEDRLTILEDSFNRCIMLGVYPDTCEGIAAEASGLAGGGE